ncbi:MAG: glycerophosphodiester phosphodiesterase [Candidatus Zipacnadales bacterium]
MYAPCWNCGQDIWIETQTECRHCGEPSKRCIDCVNYVASTSQCRALGVAISKTDAVTPSSLAQSYRCPSYQQSPAAAQQALSHKGKAPAKQTTAPAKPATPTVVRPQPVRRAEPTTAGAEKPQRPHVIAHRGCSEEAPENTLAAIRLAAEIGCDAIEIDVHITKDGVPVVIHDATLDRTTDGSGPVAEATLRHVQSLDAGKWFSNRFIGERVPTLEQAIEAAGWALLGIHMRCHENESSRAEKAILNDLRSTGALKRSWIIHHTRHSLHRFRRMDENIRLCWLPPGGGKDLEYIDDAYYMGYNIIQPTYRAVTPEFVEYARKKKMWINVFWADDEHLMRQLTEMGVNGILTNKPELLQKVLGVR